MATTGTTTFHPAASSLMLVAFGRIGIRPAAITAQHLVDAENEANLVQAMLANKQPNLWTSQLTSTTLVASTAAYTLAASTVALQAVYISTTSGSTTTDRVIWPVSATEYAALPNKATEGVPTTYWYNRQVTPEITLWPVPDDATTYTLKIRAMTQIEDVSLKSGANLQMPYRWLDVFVAELAYRLAVHYAPDREAAREKDAAKAWAAAATEDKENVPLIFSLSGMGAYYS